jgi:hypothetical protein
MATASFGTNSFESPGAVYAPTEPAFRFERKPSALFRAIPKAQRFFLVFFASFASPREKFREL